MAEFEQAFALTKVALADPLRTVPEKGKKNWLIYSIYGTVPIKKVKCEANEI
jgi:hypothetical protein